MNDEAAIAADRARLKPVFFAIWLAILAGLVVIYAIFGRGAISRAEEDGSLVIALVALIELATSIVIRWLMLPRQTNPRKGLALFIVGIALAEACGFLGIFLGGPWRDHFFILGLLGVLQFAPFLLPKLFRAPAESFRAGA